MLRSLFSRIRTTDATKLRDTAGGTCGPGTNSRNGGRKMIVLVTIRDFAIYGSVYGDEITGRIDRELSHSVACIIDEVLPSATVQMLPSEKGEYIILLEQADTDTADPADIAYSVKIKLQSGLKKSMLQWTGIGMELGVGYSVTDAHFERQMQLPAALAQARRMASLPLDLHSTRIATEFEAILNRGDIRAHYQPILDFRKGEVHGWEALSRGPAGTQLESPLMLFEVAELMGTLFRLETICREKAMRGLGPISPNQKLFLNIHPKTVADPHFTPGNTLELLDSLGLKPENIVFEITERQSVQDFGLFFKTLAHYRSQGFLVAVDDVGAGYSGLSAIAELQPEYIKLDKSLILDIHRDPVKRALAETITSFADKIGSRIIAEGIENRDQAISLMDIGVHCGQGFHLGRPAPTKQGTNDNWAELRSIAQVSRKMVTCSIPVGDIADAPHAIAPNTLVSDAQEFFKLNRQFSSLVVADAEDNPVGLVTEYYMNRQLSAQYGIASTTNAK